MFIRHALKNSVRTLKISVATLALVAGLSSVSRADLTNAVAYGYTSTVDCYSYFNDANNLLWMNINQSGEGQLGGTAWANTVLDPTLTLLHNITNTTGIAWNAYHVTVFMPNTFTLSAASVLIPAGWTASITAPTPVLGGFQGNVDFAMGVGPVVLPGTPLRFQFDLSFADDLSYSFTENLAPGLVPEPSVIALALFGLGAVGLKRFRKVA